MDESSSKQTQRTGAMMIGTVGVVFWRGDQASNLARRAIWRWCDVAQDEQRGSPSTGLVVAGLGLCSCQKIRRQASEARSKLLCCDHSPVVCSCLYVSLYVYQSVTLLQRNVQSPGCCCYLSWHKIA